MNQTVFDRFSDNRNPQSFSSKLRFKRFSLFLDRLSVTEDDSILDVGGTIETWLGTGLENNVTLLNLSFPKKVEYESGFKCVRGDALDMGMFGDNSFDIIYSNSVIEHVGSFGNQMQFASEVQRVGKSYWVQTPNKYFPIEPHFLFPFFQFLPYGLQKWIGVNWKYSHFKKWHYSIERLTDEMRQIRLLNCGQMLDIFPGALLYRERLFGLTKSIIAYKK